MSGDPLGMVWIFTDVRIRGLGRGPAAVGAVVMTPSGHVIREGSRYIGSATNNKGEILAVEFGLELAAQILRHPEQVRAKSFMDSRVAHSYIVSGSETFPHLVEARNRVRKAALAFMDVEYQPVDRDVTAIRRAETLGRKALRDEGYATRHRASKGGSHASGRPWNPYSGQKPGEKVRDGRTRH